MNYGLRITNYELPTSQRRRGFTLLEILLATGIFMTTVVVAVAIFGTATSSSSTGDQLRQTAQSARYAFESISREARLARGLAIIDNDVKKLVIPPFAVDNQAILIYQAARQAPTADGQPTYQITRQRYELKDKQLVLSEATSPLDSSNRRRGLPIEIIVARLAEAQFWRASEKTVDAPILPGNVEAKSLKIVRHRAYPTLSQSLDTDLTSQPFIQLELVVVNKGHNPSLLNNQRIQTTLRTMIVPRDFVTTYEVVQPGLKGLN